MKRRKILWQLFPSYILLTAVSTAIVVAFGIWSVRSVYLGKNEIDLKSQTLLIGHILPPFLKENNPVVLDSLCKALGEDIPIRITLITASGQVIGDSNEDPARMDNHGHRPEIIEAIINGYGASTRYSNTLHKNLMYVAVRAESLSGETIIIRTATSLAGIDDVLYANHFKFIFVGLIIIILSGVFSLLVSRKIIQPLQKLKEGAVRFASGELNRRLPVYGSDEISTLTESMNEMAAQLHNKIETITRQKQEQEAILNSMIEGVLAVDENEHILECNHIAAGLLNLNLEHVRGLTIYEAIRHSGLQKLISETLTGQKPLKEELEITGHERRLIRVTTMNLMNMTGQAVGALIILTDITKLRRLETLRRDFVANVSHELKTPITSIRGALETILDNKLTDSGEIQRFLDMAVRHTDRLNQIVEDLLSLSRIENSGDMEKLTTDLSNVYGILKRVVGIFALSAQSKNTAIEINCDAELTARLNLALIEQAMGNLIDNAIKYIPENSRIEVVAETFENVLILSVTDNGPGIEPEHLPRLFERFYRVDKARSSRLGGSGLGLAIVKHIASAHGGTVRVVSTPGQGSKFSLIIPWRY